LATAWTGDSRVLVRDCPPFRVPAKDAAQLLQNRAVSVLSVSHLRHLMATLSSLYMRWYQNLQKNGREVNAPLSWKPVQDLAALGSLLVGLPFCAIFSARKRNAAVLNRAGSAR